MKKLAIAGASLALAAMPVLGVFAETTVKDEIMVTVNPSCELADITPANTSATNPNHYYGVGNPGDLVSLAAGTKQATSGTATSVRIACNDASGYKITAAFTPLMLNGTTSAQDIAYSASPEAAAGSKTWTAYATKAGTTPTTTAIASGASITGSSTMTDSYTFSYKAGLDNNQAAGDYTGSATYTLSANN